MSKLCVIAKVSESAREQLLRLQNVATRLGVPPRHLHGHITLAVFVDGDEVELMSHCRTTLDGQTAFAVRFEKIEVYTAPSTVVAAPPKDGTLFDLYGKIVAGHTDLLNEWTRCDIWLPHTTLLQNPDIDLEAVAAAIRAEFEPFEATITGVEFSRVVEGGYEIIGAIDFLAEGA